MAQKSILLLSTGGTIAGNVASNHAHVDAQGFRELLSNVTTMVKDKWNVSLDVTAKDLKDREGEVINVDSSNILPLHWELLSDTIYDNYDDYDAFVIIHGTNTLGYTASALSFVFENINKPVIITGSQVPIDFPGSDAIMNLDNAIRVAVWPFHPIRGVVTVFGSHIISGTRTKKSTEFDYDAFTSFNTGSLGRIGRIIDINEENLLKHNAYYEKGSEIAFSKESLIIKNHFDMNIASLTEFPGLTNDFLIGLHKNSHIKGLIIRAFGAGDMSEHLHESLQYFQKNKIPVIITTQVANGNSTFLVNEPGQIISKNKWAIPAFDMSIEAQTTKLAWLIGQNKSYGEILEMMSRNLKGELNVLKERKQ